MSRDTLHSRQAEYEKTLYNPTTRRNYAYALDRIVLILGKDRSPEDIFRAEIPELRKRLRDEFEVKGATNIAYYMTIGRAFYNWMDAMEYVPIGFNPFRPWVPLRNGRKAAPTDLDFTKV